jgi:hypothetical protein
MRLGLVGPVIVIVASTLGAHARAEGLIAGVRVSPPFFNPTVGQKEVVAFSLADRSDVTVSILDRDLVPIRVFPALKGGSGPVQVEWDGRDDRGRVIPDEAYSLRIDAVSGQRRETYEPARGFSPTVSDPKRSYFMVSGVLRYELDVPSRMHIQAGEAVLVGDPKAGKREGPVLKTIVDRAPRTAGAIVETWDGFDESRTIHIPTLKNFVISIMAESLPPNSVIAIGNREESFRHYIAAIPGRKVNGPAEGKQGHARHAGLSALEDYSPEISLTVSGERDAEGRVRVTRKQLEVTIGMNAADAALFLTSESELLLFLDEKPLLKRRPNAATALFSLDPASFPSGEHRLAVNWNSSRGPVAVRATKLIVEPPPRAAERMSR